MQLNIRPVVAPTLTNLVATPAVRAIVLKWDLPTDPTYRGAEIWSGSTNVVGSATKIGTVEGTTYTDAGGNVNPTLNRYYWVRAINVYDRADGAWSNNVMAKSQLTIDLDIAAGAVKASNLAVAAIDSATGNLAANSVTAGKIAAGVITANEIATDAITAAKIAAGAITAGKIAAGAVTTSSLQVGGDQSNLIRDPRFEDYNWWGLTPGSGHNVTRGDWAQGPTITAWKDNCSLYFYHPGHSNMKEFWTKEMMIEPGGAYYFEYQISFSGDFYGDVTVEWYMPAVSWYNMGVPNSGYVWSDGGSIQYPSNSRGLKNISGTVAIPNDPRLVKSALRIRYRVSAGSFEIGGFRIVRVQDSVLIRDGAITANKMSLPYGGYINSGQWNFDAGDGFWLQGGDDPRFSIGSGGARLTFQKSTGLLRMKGEIQGSVLRSSVFGLESARILTAWDTLAPFIIYDMGSQVRTGRGQCTVTLSGFVCPYYGQPNVFNAKRFSRGRADVWLKVANNCAWGWENFSVDVMYNNDGNWQQIGSTYVDGNTYRGLTFAMRYTTHEWWDTIQFRARTINSNSTSLTLEMTVYNFNESGNNPHTSSSVLGDGDSTGGGGVVEPEEPWCVDAETTVLAGGKFARDLAVGDLVAAWNDNVTDPAVEYVPVEQMRLGHEQSYFLRTTSGAQIIQSKSTPMTLRDGRVVTTEFMFGEEVLVNRKGKLAWETVVTLEDAGMRRVVKASMGDRMYFAGMNADATIATHNRQYKP